MDNKETSYITTLLNGLSKGERSQFDEQFLRLRKRSSVALIVSIFFGWLGMDRLYLGEMTVSPYNFALGVGKFLMCFVSLYFMVISGYIAPCPKPNGDYYFIPMVFWLSWIFIDWYLIMGAVERYNIKLAQKIYNSII